MSALRPHNRFNDADADVLVQSSDGVGFHLHRVLLAKASPVFEDMFSLPQSSPDLQTVPVTEDAATLESLLDLCYPKGRSEIKVLAQLLAVLEAVEKYQMTALHQYLEQDLMALLAVEEVDPMRTYAIASLYGFSKAASAAAQRLPHYVDHLHLDPSTMPPEFAQLSASTLYALVDYRRRCVEDAIAVLTDHSWMAFGDHGRAISISPSGHPVAKRSWAWLSCRDQRDRHEPIEVDGHVLHMKLWMKRYLTDATRALQSQGLQASVILKPFVLVPAVRMAASCPHCAATAWTELVEFGLLVSERIRETMMRTEFQAPV